MKFPKISTLLPFAVFTCVVSLINAAVICIDESSLDKVQDEKVNERQGNEDEIALNATDSNAAATNGTQPGQSQVTHFLQTVQDTLEKAKPWVVEIEKEAKRLEETAKRFGEGVIRGLGKFVDRLIGTGQGNGSGAAKPASSGEASTTSPSETTNTKDKQSDIATSTASAGAVAEVAVDAAAVAASAVDDTENEISGQHDDNTLCPDGFVADANGICLRNHK